MKILLAALVMAVALSQTAEAKTKVPPTEAKTGTEKSRPLLDQTATGGIVPSGLTSKDVEPGQAYPQPLDLHF
ncbi:MULTISPECIES: hypothetical protein [unclassified Mesorhizobium]|uniref:hypothetical protein n=1 Tax=unclassified Mesorhizobium TaxID=325217 RepID=UPI00112AE04C|nr:MULTISPECIES: hypothetical protein [unclassified Mesorhizobium]TPK96240.1 hypothetical protein FJ567_21560 [Mesorhizobium sp. B2-4-16]TPL62278.1 hypothetical protein FJ956_25670 [Mesorhizobium sp. B2-4-3]